MDYISNLAVQLWDSCINYYKVNPVIFLTVYTVKTFLWGWTLIIIVKKAIKREWNTLPGLVILNVSINISPWVYVWVCGENLPFWYSYMVYFVGGWALCYLLWDVWRRVKEHDRKERNEAGEAAERKGTGDEA